MIPILDWQKLDRPTQKAALDRATGNSANITDRVQSILTDVRQNGDAALRTLTACFDKYDGPLAFVPEEKLVDAVQALPRALCQALEESIANVTAFHRAQLPGKTKVITCPGVTCELAWRPIERVGLYAPGGRAPLFSTVIMCAIPAQLAGCATRILCTPPQKDGTVNPVILATAQMCGITQVLPLGGAQAIAALAFGTATVPKVDKIFGPGNAYVTAAKQLVAQDPEGAAIDMPAGPSEVMVIAESGADPDWIAADLLAQAEHGPDSQALLITTDPSLAAAVQQAVATQAEKLSRATLIRESLKFSRILLVPDLDTALAVANCYAPEHLILPNLNAADWLPRINNAGSVFIGPYSPETAGDYASGTNHVLPTCGYARANSSLSLLSFMKSISVQTLTQDGLKALAPSLVTLTSAEGLDAHAAAVSWRIGAK